METILSRGTLQIKNGIYQAVFRKDGKQIWRSTGIKAVRGNKKKAQARLDEIRQQLLNERPTADIPFVDFCNKWLEGKKNEVRAVSYKNYSDRLNNVILPYFKSLNLKLSDIKVVDIDNFYKAISNKNYAIGTIKIIKGALHDIFKEALRLDLIASNPCERAKAPKATKKPKEQHICTIEEIQNILKLTKGKILHDMILLTVTYGLRREEMFGLRWQDVDFENKVIHIRNTVTTAQHGKRFESETTKTESSKRDYPITEETLKVLLRQKENQEHYKSILGRDYKNGNKVFLKADGSEYHPEYARRALKTVLKKNNMELATWHSLRHSCVSYLYSITGNARLVADWVGHSNINTTMNIYAHSDFEQKKSLSEKISFR